MSPAICAASFVAWRCAASYHAGIVITARVTGSPKCASAIRRSSRRISAQTSSGETERPADSAIHVSPFGASMSSYGRMRASRRISG